eukprot:TRINITY_DN61747_c0_g1_i1.p1 TRINITY_DN61747_c0_g1~~TRINITY_DN61747_c0_g1_i1.p1  ORF type:complete len:579 (+),score=71.58 TRINITY_DN61747_c0_g1_i1:124-1860(+)
MIPPAHAPRMGHQLSPLSSVPSLTVPVVPPSDLAGCPPTAVDVDVGVSNYSRSKDGVTMSRSQRSFSTSRQRNDSSRSCSGYYSRTHTQQNDGRRRDEISRPRSHGSQRSGGLGAATWGAWGAPATMSPRVSAGDSVNRHRKAQHKGRRHSRRRRSDGRRDNEGGRRSSRGAFGRMKRDRRDYETDSSDDSRDGWKGCKRASTRSRSGCMWEDERMEAVWDSARATTQRADNGWSSHDHRGGCNGFHNGHAAPSPRWDSWAPRNWSNDVGHVWEAHERPRVDESDLSRIPWPCFVAQAAQPSATENSAMLHSKVDVERMMSSALATESPSLEAMAPPANPKEESLVGRAVSAGDTVSLSPADVANPSGSAVQSRAETDTAFAVALPSVPPCQDDRVGTMNLMLLANDVSDRAAEDAIVAAANVSCAVSPAMQTEADEALLADARALLLDFLSDVNEVMPVSVLDARLWIEDPKLAAAVRRFFPGSDTFSEAALAGRAPPCIVLGQYCLAPPHWCPPGFALLDDEKTSPQTSSPSTPQGLPQLPQVMDVCAPVQCSAVDASTAPCIPADVRTALVPSPS